MENINAIFSEELLDSILKKLSSTDLKCALLVCRCWGRIGQHPDFWSWVTLKVTHTNLEEVPQVLDFDRLKSMGKLRARVVSEELLRAIENHPGLKVLCLNQCNVSSAEPGLLANVISKMEDIDLQDAQVTDQQCQAIFSSINSQSKLKKLDMSDNDLSSVNAETLARVVTNLEVVDLFDSEMTSEQSKTIFQFIASETKLVKLYIGNNDLSAVRPETLASVVSKLEVVGLSGTDLTNQQCAEIFQLALTALKLRALCLEGNDLSTVSPHSLAVVVAKLVQINVYDTKLSPVQCEDIFKAAASDTAVLEKLDISENDLSFVDKHLLAKSVSKLQVVDLWDTKLTNEQCKEIFLCLSGDSRLKELDMSFVDLSAVDAELMALVIPKLEKAKLNSTNLTTQQIEAFFNSVTTESELKTLEMAGNNLSSANPTRLARVIADLEKINLNGTGLTAQQSLVILDCLIRDWKKLKKLHMRGSELELVDADTIAAVSTKLKLIY